MSLEWVGFGVLGWVIASVLVAAGIGRWFLVQREYDERDDLHNWRH